MLVTNIEMPGLNGMKLTEAVVRNYPGTNVLIISMYKGKQYATKIIMAGAGGYLLKDAGTTEFVAAVRAVFRGGNYVSPAISTYLVAKAGRKNNFDKF